MIKSSYAFSFKSGSPPYAALDTYRVHHQHVKSEKQLAYNCSVVTNDIDLTPDRQKQFFFLFGLFSWLTSVYRQYIDNVSYYFLIFSPGKQGSRTEN